jgi:hypothetical protein
VAGRVLFTVLVVEAVGSVWRRDLVGLLMMFVAVGDVAAVAAGR